MVREKLSAPAHTPTRSFPNPTATWGEEAGGLSNSWRSNQGGESSKNPSRARHLHFSCVLRPARGAIDVKARPPLHSAPHISIPPSIHVCLTERVQVVLPRGL